MYDTEFQYFFSTATVKPRSNKYVVDLTADGQGKHVLQLEATVFDMDKAAEQEAFRNSTTGLISNEANWQRTRVSLRVEAHVHGTPTFPPQR